MKRTIPTIEEILRDFRFRVYMLVWPDFKTKQISWAYTAYKDRCPQWLKDFYE